MIRRQNSVEGLTCAPTPLVSIRPDLAYDLAACRKVRRIEPKICFRIGSNLPDDNALFTSGCVVGAIERCHPKDSPQRDPAGGLVAPLRV
jgi:hypothetical protein